MRVSKKREILQCIDMLKKANRKLKLIRYGTANELLEQCQELAIAVGDQIEGSGEEVAVTISYLEEYCEILYKAFICKDKTEYNQIINSISTLLKKVEISIKEDIEDSPFEVVFMPYKASMWDSMDSVYRAAMNDQHCNVVVMPVPYYNPNQKEHRVEMHYEGDQFPEDIPITDFRNYSLENTYPDVIIIHNPYDQCNYVTQLPEQYFSSNLIKYTEHLVYIPYFITKGDRIKEDYCVMPAVKNAWKTFVQSEAVRKDYLKYGADPKRIVAIGSPKFDMVIRMQDTPPELPEKWKDVVKGRKVFLLNTHLNPIINEAEKAIDKLHRIFTLFAEHKEAALLWRPHPLSIETAKSMNPQMLEKYLGIIQEFKTLSNGIYDDTPDIHRAIAVSDAYVGDWSSVATLYGITGKPMYIMGIQVDTNIEESEKEKKEKERRLSFSSAAELDGYMWVPGDEMNGLFRICEETGESKFITAFYKENLYGELLYSGVVTYGRKLFFVPYNAKYIAGYNVDTSEMEYYDVKGSDKEGIIKFGGYFVRDNKLYLFPAKVRDIICFNMDNGKIQQCKWVYEDLPLEIRKNPYTMFMHEINVNNIEYLPCAQANMFVKLDMKDFHYEVIKINEIKEGLVDVAFKKDILYFLTTGGDIVTYNIETEEIKLFWRNIQKKIDGNIPYYRLLILNDFLWLIPTFYGNICKLNIKTKKLYKIINYPEGFVFLKENSPHPYKWLNGEIRNSNLYLYPCRANMLLKWDGIQEKVKGIKIRMPDDRNWEKFKMLQNKNGYLYYESIFSLFHFVDVVIKGKDGYKELRKKYFKELQWRTDGLCGDSIWKYIKTNLR